MRLPVLAAALALAVLVPLAAARADEAPAPQDPRCIDGGVALRGLMRGFHEQPAWRGALRQGYAAVLTASPDGKSWTVLVVRPDGAVCVVLAGGQSEFALRERTPDPPGRPGQ